MIAGDRGRRFFAARLAFVFCIWTVQNKEEKTKNRVSAKCANSNGKWLAAAIVEPCRIVCLINNYQKFCPWAAISVLIFFGNNVGLIRQNATNRFGIGCVRCNGTHRWCTFICILLGTGIGRCACTQQCRRSRTISTIAIHFLGRCFT